MDHSYPLDPVDGLDHGILAIRDLASGYQLAFDAVPDESADYVVGTLMILFRPAPGPQGRQRQRRGLSPFSSAPSKMGTDPLAFLRNTMAPSRRPTAR